jgi:hypothetical protein
MHYVSSAKVAIIIPYMTPDDTVSKIKELEQQFLTKIEDIRKDYTTKIRDVITDVEKKKIEALKKDLGI